MENISEYYIKKYGNLDIDEKLFMIDHYETRLKEFKYEVERYEKNIEVLKAMLDE